MGICSSKNGGRMRKFTLMILNIVLFYSIAVGFWLAFHEIFYLYNFGIIGTAGALGLGLWPLLPKEKKHIARKLSQALVGGYMFLGLGTGLIYIAFGFIQPENMQIEGFWFLLFGGVFAASVMHYVIAKITGPFIYNRSWCGWGCWTAGLLDLLPWTKSPGRLPAKWGYLRYIYFLSSLLVVALLVFVGRYSAHSLSGVVNLSGRPDLERVYQNLFYIPEFWWFAVGNFLYYAIGIILAAILKDNRAFCKYVCPVAAFLKIGARFALLRVEARGGCVYCGKCDLACPMDIQITRYIKDGRRILSTECIVCLTCVNSCPLNLLTPTFRLDRTGKELLRQKRL